MDNLPAHKVDGARQLIEKRGARLHYLPAYSPDFNPIEMCWSKFNSFCAVRAPELCPFFNSPLPMR
jgi:transposase